MSDKKSSSVRGTMLGGGEGEAVDKATTGSVLQLAVWMGWPVYIGGARFVSCMGALFTRRNSMYQSRWSTF